MNAPNVKRGGPLSASRTPSQIPRATRFPHLPNIQLAVQIAIALFGAQLHAHVDIPQLGLVGRQVGTEQRHSRTPKKYCGSVSITLARSISPAIRSSALARVTPTFFFAKCYPPP